MNTITYTTLVERENELERKRSVALARQQWATALELEARIDECKLWRKRIAAAKDVEERSQALTATEVRS